MRLSELRLTLRLLSGILGERLWILSYDVLASQLYIIHIHRSKPPGRAVLLRRITQNVKNQNWFAVALDFVIVVAGILIAFQITKWNEGRVSQSTEQVLLQEMHVRLSKDSEEIQENLQKYRELETFHIDLLEKLSHPEEALNLSNTEFGRVYGFHYLEIDYSTFETLKSQGFDLISDATLRSQIAEVYEESLIRLEKVAELDQNVILGLWRPYYLQEFSDLRFLDSATPLSLDVIIDDPYYKNLVSYRLYIIEENLNPTYEQALRSVNKLKDTIEMQLSRN